MCQHVYTLPANVSGPRLEWWRRKWDVQEGTVPEEQVKNLAWATERGRAGRVVSGEAGTMPWVRCVLSEVAAAAVK